MLTISICLPWPFTGIVHRYTAVILSFGDPVVRCRCPPSFSVLVLSASDISWEILAHANELELVMPLPTSLCCLCEFLA